MGKTRRFFGDRRGASAVEFALVIVPLLLFIFGTIEFSRLMWTRQSMQSLAVSAARCVGILQPACISGTAYNESNTKSYIIARAASFGVPLSTGDIAVVNGTTCNGVSGFAKVTITYTFTSVAPKLITAIASSGLSTSACFPIQL
ncbi:MAG: TadE/TadG family type IV pilus assembly protein [Sphingomonadales bacterium]